VSVYWLVAPLLLTKGMDGLQSHVINLHSKKCIFVASRDLFYILNMFLISFFFLKEFFFLLTTLKTKRDIHFEIFFLLINHLGDNLPQYTIMILNDMNRPLSCS